jgi:hypothetical protein
LEAQLTALRHQRERAIERSSWVGWLRKLEDGLLGTGTLSDERWASLPAARRREFLALLFPHGIFVDAPGPD